MQNLLTKLARLFVDKKRIETTIGKKKNSDDKPLKVRLKEINEEINSRDVVEFYNLKTAPFSCVQDSK